MVDRNAVRQRLIGSKTERAVSPVIGVILMVAITVVLAAVIATFIAGIGPSGEVTPNSNLEIEYAPDSGESGELSVIHNGGDSFDADDVTVTVQGEPGAVEFSEMVDDSDAFSVGDVASTPALGNGGLDVAGETATVLVIHDPIDSSIASATIDFEEGDGEAEGDDA